MKLITFSALALGALACTAIPTTSTNRTPYPESIKSELQAACIEKLGLQNKEFCSCHVQETEKRIELGDFLEWGAVPVGEEDPIIDKEVDKAIGACFHLLEE